jgi:hypothetical protein
MLRPVLRPRRRFVVIQRVRADTLCEADSSAGHSGEGTGKTR